MCTGMMALVRGVIAASTLLMSRLCVRASISANTGFAPHSRITLDVATHELGVVMTSSPGPTPAMRSPISRVQEPELNVLTGRPWKYLDRRASNVWTRAPLPVSQPERSTSTTAAIVASSTVGRVKGRNDWEEASLMRSLESCGARARIIAAAPPAGLRG